MQMLQRIKKYKDLPPEETVDRIRKILFDLGIDIEEKYYHIETGDIHSCRIRIANDRLWELNIGTNGKGMDVSYTRASAYGEFMERLSNDLLLPYVSINAKKQKVMSAKDAQPYLKEFFQRVFREKEIVTEYALKKGLNIRMEEFEDVLSGKKTLLPINYVESLNGSNGMCAGNSKEEAIIQGISEIFERNAVYRVIMEDLTPPEIDEGLFADTAVINKLNALRDNGYEYRILDYSLGEGYPVIGLLLSHHGKNRVCVGSDPSPITALERCITEIFQGYQYLEECAFTDSETWALERQNFEGTEEEFRFLQYRKTVLAGMCCVPPGIFEKGRQKSYEFAGFAHPVSISNEDDLNYYYEVIRKNKKRLYIADRSFLGFPAYYTVIPSLSEMIRKDDGTFFIEKLGCSEKCLDIIKAPFMSKEELIRLADAMEERRIRYTPDMQYVDGLFPPGIFKPFHVDKVMAFLYACAGEKGKAEQCLARFFETERGMYEPQLTNRRLVREGKKEECFPAADWPACPDCDSCGVKDKCRRDDAIALCEHIQEYAATGEK